MATRADVRRIAVSLPETQEEPGFSCIPAIELDLLEKILTDAWLTRASKKLAATLED